MTRYDDVRAALARHIPAMRSRIAGLPESVTAQAARVALDHVERLLKSQSMRFPDQARGATGQFARHGSAEHYHAHLGVYRTQKATGEVAGTRADFDAHRQQWHGVKRQEQIRLTQEWRHAEAELRGMTEDEAGYTALAAKVDGLRKKVKG